MRLSAALLILLATLAPASAGVRIEVDRSTQTMRVNVDGVQRHVWPVSTGLTRHRTPGGAFTPTSLKKMHYSRKYDNAPMPHSIFFTKWGHAIHGTNHVRALGSPASHGCVRLTQDHAAQLYALVAQRRNDTEIVITGSLEAFAKPKEKPRRRATLRGESEGEYEATRSTARDWDVRYYESRWVHDE